MLVTKVFRGTPTGKPAVTVVATTIMKKKTVLFFCYCGGSRILSDVEGNNDYNSDGSDDGDDTW